MTTLRQALKTGTQTINQVMRDMESSALEARLILFHFTGLSLTQFMLKIDEEMEEETLDAYLEGIYLRSTGIPIQYILESQLFYEREFICKPQVLIPRWDSEVLVRAALKGKGDRVLELGCGSGALIITLLLEKPLLKGTAVDINPKALELTKMNGEKFHIMDRLELRSGSWFEPVKEEEKWDMIISNPPYVTTKEMEELPLEVTKEPVNALWGGEEGLDPYKEIIPKAYPHLEKGGLLALEHGYKQGGKIRDLLDLYGYAGIETFKDNGNRERVTIGWKL